MAISHKIGCFNQLYHAFLTRYEIKNAALLRIYMYSYNFTLTDNTGGMIRSFSLLCSAHSLN
jgi:hypothetical protein